MKKGRKNFFFEKKKQKTFAHGCSNGASKQHTETPLPPLRGRGRGPARQGWEGEGPRAATRIIVERLLAAHNEFRRLAQLSLCVIFSYIGASSAYAADTSFEAFISIKPNGQYTWNDRTVPNYLALSALFSANSGRHPKPIVRIWQCNRACPTEVEMVVKLAEHYNFDPYTLSVHRVGNPVSLP